MNVINSYSNKRFTLNGIQYLKNYTSRVSGNRVQVYNCYDNSDVLCEYDIYSQYVVNGVTFANAALLQEALLDVIFSRGTLGNDVGELVQDNKRLVKEVTILTSDNESQILDRINELPLYLVDEYTLVSFKCSDGVDRNIIYNTVGVGKGSYGDGGTQLTLENLFKVYEYVPGYNQNNLHYIITYTATASDNTPLSTQQVANLMNATLPVSFGETQVPWIAVNVIGTTPVIKHVYWFKAGKGLWGGPEGSGGTTVEKSMLQFLLTQNATPDDVQDGGNTSVIPLGTLTDGDYITAANAVERDLTNPDLFYFLKFTYDGIDYLLQFIGTTYGLYGGANVLQFVEADFEEMPVVVVPEPSVPTLKQVTDGTGHGYTEYPIIVQGINPSTLAPIEKTVYSANGISYQPEGGNWTSLEIEEGTEDGLTRTFPASDQDEDVAYRSDLLTRVPVPMPDDFFVSADFNGSTIVYKTDTYRYLDIQPLIPVETGITISVLNEVVRDGDNLIFTGNFFFGIGADPAIMVVLHNVKIVDNIISIGNVTATTLPVNRIHGLRFSRGYAFCMNRSDDNTDSSTLVKINPYDLSDVKSYKFPVTTPYLGDTTDLLVYKDKLYMLFSIGGTSFAYFVEIDENLTSHTLLFTAGNVNAQNRIRPAAPFMIYNDEIYIPTYSNTAPSAYNTMGITVYGFDGTIKRSVQQVAVNTGFTATDNIHQPHWMTIINGKIIITNFPNSATGSHRELTRWDCQTLALEEVVQLNIACTDDNSVTKDGYLLLNGEAVPPYYTGATDISGKLLKIKYNDFSDYTVEISNYFDGYGAAASLNFYPAEETHKYKLSHFVNDSVAATGTVTGSNLSGINTGDNAANATSNAYADAKVQNSLSASTTIAPSATAVNNALLFYPKIIFSSSTTYAGTGSTSSILLKAVSVPANTLSNGVVSVYASALFTGTAGTKQIEIYINTSASLSGATRIALGASNAAANTQTEVYRNFKLNGTTLRGLASGFATVNFPTTTTSTPLSTTLNPANQYYIIAACVNGSSADTTTLDGFEITFKKATE